MDRPKVIALISLMTASLFCNAWGEQPGRVTVPSDEWALIGDLQVPATEGNLPVVLLLNQAAGNRHAYQELASHLSKRGIASLRLDLRGHGESTNLDRFVPGESDADAMRVMIWEAQADVIAAHEFLKSYPGLDPDRIAIVGASYSGEEMAEAGRTGGFAQAYVALSPGSFSADSIAAIDDSGVPWLFVVAREDPFLKEITASVQNTTKSVEIVQIPGTAHATGILESRPDIAERIVAWLARTLEN